MKQKAGYLILVLGLLFFGAALFVTGHMLYTERKANQEAEKTAEELLALIPEREETKPSQVILSTEASEAATDEIQTEAGAAADTQSETARKPSSVKETEAEIVIDGAEYIGVLQIPDLGLTLPIMGSWSYPKLKKAPCRYQGSVEEKNLIIAGHNYSRHFGHLDQLTAGSKVLFTDAGGTAYSYTVTGTEVLAKTDVDGMVSGDWDLTLFTCTVGGLNRVTVRCKLEEDIQAEENAEIGASTENGTDSESEADTADGKDAENGEEKSNLTDASKSVQEIGPGYEDGQ